MPEELANQQAQSMLILALLAPFGAITLSLVLALAVCHAALFALLYHCCMGRHRGFQPVDVAAVQSLSMLGMQVEDLPGETWGWRLAVFRKVQQWSLPRKVQQWPLPNLAWLELLHRAFCLPPSFSDISQVVPS